MEIGLTVGNITEEMWEQFFHFQKNLYQEMTKKEIKEEEKHNQSLSAWASNPELFGDDWEVICYSH